MCDGQNYDSQDRASIAASRGKNCNISETIHPISPKFDDETHTVNDVVGGPPLPYMKYNMADVRHLENRQNVKDRPPMVRFTQNLVCRCKMRC